MKKIILMTIFTGIVLVSLSHKNNEVFAENSINVYQTTSLSKFTSEYVNLKNEINQFYIYENEYKNLNNTVTQSKIDSLLFRVHQLSSSEEKLLLAKELEKIQNNLSELQIKAKNGEIVAQVDAINNHNKIDLYVRTFSNNFSGNNDVSYGQINVKEKIGSRIRPIFNKTYKPGKYVTSVKKLRSTNEGTLIISTKDVPLEVNSTVKLSTLSTGTYEFKINDSKGCLELQSFTPVC